MYADVCVSDLSSFRRDVDAVHDLMDDIQEQQELAQEVTEAISNPFSLGQDIDDVSDGRFSVMVLAQCAKSDLEIPCWIILHVQHFVRIKHAKHFPQLQTVIKILDTICVCMEIFHANFVYSECIKFVVQQQCMTVLFDGFAPL